MRIGTVREIKAFERRVGLAPALAAELGGAGHTVLVEAGAGDGAGFDDLDYTTAGARVVADAAEVWERSELLVKVKEPVPSEYDRLHAGLTLFCYLHLAAEPRLTAALVESGVTAIAYETVEDSAGWLSLLAPMSEIAGRLAAQAAAHHLCAPHGGAGILIGGAPGVAPASVLVLGGGTAGMQAATVAAGMGARVTVLERSPARIRELEQLLDGRATVLMSDRATVAEELGGSDVVIGSVLVTGARAPTLVDRSMLAAMRPGSVAVDIAVDQGGCLETSRPTTHGDPVYEVDGVVHYCVANMPGAVPITATRALTNATAPYVTRLAAQGIEAALAEDEDLARGLNVCDSRVVSAPVAAAYAAHGNDLSRRPLSTVSIPEEVPE